MTRLIVKKLTVKQTRIMCDLAVEGAESHHHTQTNPQLISILNKRYPTLLNHACVNNEGDTFGAVADHTSLPHLVEHLIIAIQAESENGAPLATENHSFTFIGTTEWVNRAHSEARIEVNFRDDLIALRAIRDAVALVNDLLAQ